MSDWSLISGKSSNKSEDGFMIVDNNQDCAEPVQPPTADNQIKQLLKPSTSDCAEPVQPPTVDNQIKQWLKSSTSEITNNLTKPSRSKEIRFECQLEAQDQSRSLLDNTTSISTPEAATAPQSVLPSIKIYSIRISEFPKTAPLRGSCNFSLSTDPSTWYSAVVGHGSHANLSSAIFFNIECVLQHRGYHGLLEIILWANVFNVRAGEGDFWKDVEEAALRRLPRQDALVVVSVFMSSVKSRVRSRLTKKYGVGSVDAFFKGDRFRFAVKKRTGFAWMSAKEAEDFQLGKDAK